jgi:hypothetical protein
MGPTTPPLALEGYWRVGSDDLEDNSTAPPTFYACLEGMCEAETISSTGAIVVGNSSAARRRRLADAGTPMSANCRAGHAGRVCGMCVDGFAQQDGFCETCTGEKKLSDWSTASQEALTACLCVAFVIISAAYLLLPLFPDAKGDAMDAARAVVAAIRCKRSSAATDSGAAGAERGAAWAAADVRTNTPTTPLRAVAEEAETAHTNGGAAETPTSALAAAPGGEEVDPLDALETHAPPTSARPPPPPPPLPPRQASRQLSTRSHSSHASGQAHAPGGAYSRMALLLSTIAFFSEPLMLLIENLQIVSSFQRTLRVQWPASFYKAIGRLSILNFNFLALPKTACATPEVSFYASFHGITLGVTGMVLYMLIIWAVGRTWATRTASGRARVDPESVATFDRTTFSRTLLLLEICYAPIAETLLALYGCREIGGRYWLVQAVDVQCYTPEHNAFRRLGAFWVALYVVGVPCVFLGALVYYRVPAAAAHLRLTAQLRTLADVAWQRGVARMEGVNTSALTPTNITDEHLNALFIGLLGNTRHVPRVEGQAGSPPRSPRSPRHPKHGGGGDDEEHGGDGALSADDVADSAAAAAAAAVAAADAAAVAAMPREVKMAKLINWCGKNVHLSHYSWEELRDGSEDDLRREGAEEAVGDLYEPFYPVRWYYKIIEQVIKLILTSVLLFIAPGTPAQIVAGLFISFAVLLLFLRLLPYGSKPLRRVAYAGNLVIFIFFVVGLMIKMKVPIGNSDTTDAFYAATVGVLIYALFVAPAIISANSGFMQRIKHNVKHKLTPE